MTTSKVLMGAAKCPARPRWGPARVVATMSLRCAVLARKSNQQEATGEEKSVALQERECRALIERNGWELTDGHLYIEDAVSGALMTAEGRPELFPSARPGTARRAPDAAASACTRPRPLPAIARNAAAANARARRQC